jgi:DNA-binding beta-propeller fold protein YncE
VKRLAFISIGIAAVGAAGALLSWSWYWRDRSPLLEPRWTATAVVLAGDGVAGMRDGPRETARFSDPFGVAAAPDGTVYVGDAGEAQRIRRVSASGEVTTLAGGARGFADGTGGAARFNTPSAIAIDASGILYVADTGNNAIRRVTPGGIVTTLAGDGEAGYRDGIGRDARFNGPLGIAIDRSGRILVADTYNDLIRAIAPDGSVTTIAGAGQPGFADGTGIAARFDTPAGIAIDAAGSIVIADTGNDALRAIDPSGAVTTLAVDGLSRPIGLATGAANELYVSDARGRILARSADGSVRTLAGDTPGFQDGPGDEARFRAPSGLAAAGLARIVVADTGNALVRIVAARSRLPLLPPASARIRPRFDSERFDASPLLWPIEPMDGPHEIAGTLGEARGVEGAERFHAGIDVRIDEGTPVLAVRDGTVSQPLAAHDFGSLNESMRIGTVAYVHMRAGRGRGNVMLDPDRFVPTYDDTGALVRVRVKRGAAFFTGQTIGSVNAFNHVHLNVGWPGEEYNPLLFDLVHFEDRVPPSIARGGVRLVDEFGQPFKQRVRGRLVVSGRVQVVVDAWDQADGNRPNRRLGLFDLGYQILRRDGVPMEGYESAHRTLRFDRLAIDPRAATLAYAPGSGIPFYRGRRTRFLYIVTNTLRDGIASPGAWDTTALPPGDYIVRAWVADIRGNSAVANRDVAVTIPAPGNH